MPFHQNGNVDVQASGWRGALPLSEVEDASLFEPLDARSRHRGETLMRPNGGPG